MLGAIWSNRCTHGTDCLWTDGLARNVRSRVDVIRKIGAVLKPREVLRVGDISFIWLRLEVCTNCA